MENNGLIPLQKKEAPAIPSSHFHPRNRFDPSSAAPTTPIISAAPAPQLPKGQVIPKFILPPLPPPVSPKSSLPGVPSPSQQSWGAVISIIIIVLMIIIGAFYAWGKRIAQERALLAPVTAQ